MKNIYNAPNKEIETAELDNLKKWGGKVSLIPTFMEKQLGCSDCFLPILTDNQKVHQIKALIPFSRCRKKTVYLSLMEIKKKWTQPIHNWGLIMNQFMLMFENRIQI